MKNKRTKSVIAHNVFWEDLLTALDDEEIGDEAFTVRELVHLLNIKSRSTVQQYLQDAMQAGLCECVGKKPVASIDGSIRKAPAYRFNMSKIKKLGL